MTEPSRPQEIANGCPICAKADERNGERNGARVQLWLSERRAVMFVEHDFDIIARYAPRVAFAQGTIIAEGASAVIGDAQVKRCILGKAPSLRRAAAAPS